MSQVGHECVVGVELVGQPPVRGLGDDDQAAEGGGHGGAVGEPPESPLRGWRGELRPGEQGRGTVIDARAGQDVLGRGQCAAAACRVLRWAKAPAGPALTGAPLCFCAHLGDPGGQGFCPRLASEVEQQDGQVAHGVEVLPARCRSAPASLPARW